MGNDHPQIVLVAFKVIVPVGEVRDVRDVGCCYYNYYNYLHMPICYHYYICQTDILTTID